MAGSIKHASVLLLQMVLIVFLIGMAAPQRSLTCDGGQYVPPRDRTVFLCTTLAAALVLWFAKKVAADGGGGARLLRGLLLLGLGLSAASIFLFLEPVAGYAITIYRLGCDGSVALAADGLATVAVVTCVCVRFAAEALFDPY